MIITVYCEKCGTKYSGEQIRPDIKLLECTAKDCNEKEFVTEIDEMYYNL